MLEIGLASEQLIVRNPDSLAGRVIDNLQRSPARSMSRRRRSRESSLFDQRAAHSEDQPVGELGLGRGVSVTRSPSSLDLDVAHTGKFLERRHHALDQFAEVRALLRAGGRGMDLGSEVEVIDRCQQKPGLPDDLLRTLAIPTSRGTEILPFDDLCEPDDGVERCLDLVD